jgi:hypothetical protein
MLRRSGRRRLGATEGEDAPRLLLRLDAAAFTRLLGEALELQRRLEGDRPPNAKLALTTLLLGCAPGPRAAAAGGAPGPGGGLR